MSTTDNLEQAQAIAAALEAAGFEVRIEVDAGTIRLEAEGDAYEVDPSGIGGGGTKNGDPQ